MVHAFAHALFATLVPLVAQVESPLHARAEVRIEGRAALESLKAHLAPPRHRMGAQVEVTRHPMVHGPLPGSVGEVLEKHELRVFSVGGGAVAGSSEGWRLDVTVSDGLNAKPPGKLRINDGFVLEDVSGPSGSLETEADVLRAQIVFRAAFPATLIHYLARVGRVLDFDDRGSGGADVLLDCGAGQVLVRTVPLAYGDQEVPGLIGVDWVTHDRFLGDVVESLEYVAGDASAPGAVSGWRIQGPIGTSESATVVSVELDSKELPFEGGLFPLRDDVPILSDSPAPKIEVRELGDGLLELLCARDQSRTLALDLGSGWAVLEAPVSSSVGEALVAALEAERPGHPFLYAAASHHHPHYIGGLRPFVHRGARVVCAEEIAEYVEHVITRPRTLQPDALGLSARSPEIVAVPRGERWAPPGSPERWVAVEADGRSNHTDAFLVFFLPEHELAFGGDLLWLPSAEGAPARKNPRTAGLATVLEDAGDLGAVEFLTSWPAGLPEGRWRDRALVEEILLAR